MIIPTWTAAPFRQDKMVNNNLLLNGKGMKIPWTSRHRDRKIYAGLPLKVHWWPWENSPVVITTFSCTHNLKRPHTSLTNSPRCSSPTQFMWYRGTVECAICINLINPAAVCPLAVMPTFDCHIWIGTTSPQKQPLRSRGALFRWPRPDVLLP